MVRTPTTPGAHAAHGTAVAAAVLLGLLLVGLALSLAATTNGRVVTPPGARARRAERERFLNVTKYERCANEKRRVWCRTDIDYSADLDDDALDATDISTCEFAASMRMQDEHNERVTDAIYAAVKDKDVTNSIVTLTAPLSTQSPSAASAGKSETVLVEDEEVVEEVEVAAEEVDDNPNGLPLCSDLCDDAISPVAQPPVGDDNPANAPCRPGQTECCAHDERETQEQAGAQRSGGFCYKYTGRCSGGTTRCFVDTKFRQSMEEYFRKNPDNDASKLS